MSWSVDLLVVSKKSLQVVAKDIGYMLKLPVERMESDEEVYFLYKLEAQIIVGENNFINDRDLVFEAYDILVSIWSTKLPNWQSSEEECRNVGIDLFNKLKKSYCTSLLLVENAQKRLLTFDPDF